MVYPPAHMPTKLDDLHIERVAGVDHPAHLEEGWLVIKSATSPTSPDDLAALLASVTTTTKESHMPEHDDELAVVKARAEAAEAKVTELEKAFPPKKVAKTDQADGGKDDPDADDVSKALADLPPALRTRLEKAFAAESEIVEAHAEVRKEREIRLDAECVAKARDWTLPSLKPTEFGPQFRLIQEAFPEVAKTLEGIFASTAAVIKSSNLLKEIGESVGQTDMTADPAEKLNALAKAKESADSIPFHKAYDQVLATPEGQALYAEYMSAKTSKGGAR